MPETNPLAFVQDLVLGGTSGVIAKTVCAPLERVKILLQVGSVNSGAPQYSGMMDALVRVPREQGVKALWRGNLSNCEARSVAASKADFLIDLVPSTRQA